MGAEAHPSTACPDDEVLALLVDGSLEPAEDAAVRKHLDACDACRVLFADVARALDSGVGARGAARGAPAEHNFHKGDIFASKYKIDRLLGKGGMGQVFAARHVELNKLVALKVMRPDMTKDVDAVRRFAREAKAAASLRSEHCVRILDVGRIEETETPYIVMEYLDGHDLGSIAPKTLPIVDAVRYVRQACEALSDAHAAGIIHRDVKPHNLFLTRDASGEPFIKVLDFGLAKARGEWKALQDSSNTATNVMLGSPFFMSPEQIESAKSVDHRTDIWSLGATLYQLLTGGPPFLAPNVHIICARILTEDFPPARSKRVDVPTDLEALLRRCMNRDLKARFQSVDALARALDDILTPFDAFSSSDDTVNNKTRADMLDPPTVATGPNLEAATRPVAAVSSAPMPSPDEDPTVGNEPWRDWRRPLERDDTTATNQMVAPPRTARAMDPVTMPAPPPPPPAALAAVKDTITENRPPMGALSTPFDLQVPQTPQRISTLPMPAPVSSRTVQVGRARIALVVLAFVAVAAAIVAFSFWRGDLSSSTESRTTPSASIAPPPAESTAPVVTAPVTAAANVPTPTQTATPSATTSIAAAPLRTIGKPPPAPPAIKKPPVTRPQPTGTHDPYAAP